jgi:hypothetical protein
MGDKKIWKEFHFPCRILVSELTGLIAGFIRVIRGREEVTPGTTPIFWE